jgi:plastocyanin
MRVVPVGLFLLFAACNDATTETEAPARNSVLVEQTAFTPRIVNVRVGGTIEFNFGATPHQVIFDDLPGKPENIESMLSNTQEVRTFPVDGTYTFSCPGSDHGSMRGTITVVPVTGEEE